MRAHYPHLGIGALVCTVHIAAAAEIPAGPPAVELHNIRKALRPLCEPMDKPGSSDWLAVHDEPGQTFAQYLE